MKTWWSVYMIRFTPIFSIVLFSIFFLSCKNEKAQHTPVTPFVAEKYLGTWYEIARLPNSFEKGMTHVTATYSQEENGKIKVLNQGILNKKQKDAIGKAYLAGASNEGFLKVSFFGPFYANYIIVDLDENYTYAMVASSPKYLWILSREPALDKVVLDRLLEKAKELGFDTSKLYFTPQKG